MELQRYREFGIIGIVKKDCYNQMDTNETKYDNKYLLERQLEMLKTFYERNLLTKEQYEYEIEVLTTKIKIDAENDNKKGST